MTQPKTSWGGEADWYRELVVKPDSYQRQVILPNLLRLVKAAAGQTVLDLACGSGFFAREVAAHGAKVIGADISQELIEAARRDSPDQIDFFVAPADKLTEIESASIDTVFCVLAIQNIAPVRETFMEVRRVLKPGGRLILVLNHPAFRIPKASSWGWDESAGVQYRRVDKYLSEFSTPIQMHPGAKPESKTLSFHRPLQWYFKLLTNQGFVVTRLEEWISHRESESGPKKQAEDLARKEIPLFMALELRQVDA